MSGNSALFDHLTEHARAWQTRYGTKCGPEAARSILRPYLRQIVDGGYLGERQPETVVASTVERVAAYWAKGGWGWIKIRGAIRRGSGVRPRGEPRPHLTKASYGPAREAAEVARAELQAEGVERPTLSQIVKRAATAAARVTIGHVRDLAESAVTKKAIDALPGKLSGLCRDLRRELPTSRVHVIELDDVAAGLATPSACESTRRTHRRRARLALERIAEQRVGLKVAILGKLAVIGRRRALPKDLQGFVATATVRRIDPNLLRSGQEWSPDAEKTDAEKARAVADQLVDFVEAWVEHGPHVVDVADHMLSPAAAQDELPESASDLDYSRWTMRHLDRQVGYWGRSFPHDDLAWTLGVAPRGRFDPRWNGSDQTSEAAVEHHAAFNEIRVRYGQGADLGSLYRYCYERGGLPMAAAARKVAAALDGVQEPRSDVIPHAGTPGRRRIHPSAKAKPIPPRAYVPWQTVPTPQPVSQAALDSLKFIPDALLPKPIIERPTHEYSPLRDGLPWFLRAA